MKRAKSAPVILLAQTALLATALLAIGCDSHPDDKAAVYAALDKGNISSVMVKQDRLSGVLTLTGIVSTPAVKALAEAVAGQAAPGYRIANEIQVHSTGT